MSGTVWSPLSRYEPRSWLLSDGSVISEPPLEESGSGRRVRVAGQNDTSTYSNDLDGMLTRAAFAAANRRGTNVLLELTGGLKKKAALAMGFDPGVHSSAILGPVHDPENRQNITYCWWKFRHPDIPQFEAYVTVTMRGEASLSYNRNLTVWMPVRNYRWGDTHTFCSEVNGPYFPNITERLDSQSESEWDRWLEQNPPNWADLNLGSSRTGGARAAVKDLLAVVRRVEEYEYLEVPDFRDTDNPCLVPLQLVATNVNGQFISDMTEYLDGTPHVERALQHYKDLIQMLRSMGMDVQAPDTVDNDLAAAMLAGQTGVLNLKVVNPVNPEPDCEFEIDHQHTVSLHLPTGTFLVDCHVRPDDPEEIDQKWQEAKTIARLTGEEDELLAYARAYAAQQRSGNAQRIFAVRT